VRNKNADRLSKHGDVTTVGNASENGFGQIKDPQPIADLLKLLPLNRGDGLSVTE
jgi:hypothetical protein